MIDVLLGGLALQNLQFEYKEASPNLLPPHVSPKQDYIGAAPSTQKKCYRVQFVKAELFGTGPGPQNVDEISVGNCQTPN